MATQVIDKSNGTEVKDPEVILPSLIEPSSSPVWRGCYTMRYKPDRFTQAVDKNFYCEGGFNAAKRRANKHCAIMNYEFVFLLPMFHDLEYEENHVNEDKRSQV